MSTSQLTTTLIRKTVSSLNPILKNLRLGMVSDALIFRGELVAPGDGSKRERVVHNHDGRLRPRVNSNFSDDVIQLRLAFKFLCKFEVLAPLSHTRRKT